MKRGGLVGLLIILLLSCGCATIAGTPGTISVTTTPPGVPVYLDGVLQGNAPLTLNMVPPGTHTVEFRPASGSPWTTQVLVASGGTSSVAWNSEVAPAATPTPAYTPYAIEEIAPKGLYVTELTGYQGGGNYITQLTFNLGLAQATPVDMNATAMTFTTQAGTISPYWTITDKRYSNSDNNLLEAGEVFLISMSTPHVGPGETFTLTITPPGGEALVVTKTVPSFIGVYVKFP
ncbi:MAG: PEGA domain-containing protein [Methanoregulaceae archaeon]|nr:PEGA domain-containing protein [Methanoregulaceae archaeon]